MLLQVLRFSDSGDSTSGLLCELKPDGREFLCYTLEDESRNLKKKGETRIPEGMYELTLRTEGGFHKKYSERFPDIHEGMLWVRDVPNFEYILIHCGNTDEHTAGCLLLGDSQENNLLMENGFIGKSANAYKRVYKKILNAISEGNDIHIEYVDLEEAIVAKLTL